MLDSGRITENLRRNAGQDERFMADNEKRMDASIKTFDAISVGDRWEHSVQVDQDRIDLLPN